MYYTSFRVLTRWQFQIPFVPPAFGIPTGTTNQPVRDKPVNSPQFEPVLDPLTCSSSRNQGNFIREMWSLNALEPLCGLFLSVFCLSLFLSCLAATPDDLCITDTEWSKHRKLGVRWLFSRFEERRRRVGGRVGGHCWRACEEESKYNRNIR